MHSLASAKNRWRMKKYRFSFVILHYKNVEETLKCIASIEEMFDVEDYSIIVVDNGSGNGTGELLQQKYVNKEYVHVIINQQKSLTAKDTL